MAWVKLHDGFDDDVDIDSMSADAIALFACALTWCARNLTDGFVPEARVRKLPGGTKEAVALLCAEGRCWWVRVEGGYQIRNFLKYNPSEAEVRAHREQIRQVRSESGKKGAAVRWHSKPDSKTVDLPLANDGKDMAPYPGSRIPDTRKTRNPKKTLVTPGASPTLLWPEFLKVYPKRAGALNKAEAERKFLQLFAGPEAEKILEGAKRFRAWADATGATGTEFVPQMTTWLRQRRWLEDYEAPPKKAENGPRKADTPREPAQGTDYVLRCPDGLREARMYRPGSEELFNAAAWFDLRGLSPTRHWEGIIASYRDLFEGAA